MSKKPGVVVYFDVLPAIEKMGNERLEFDLFENTIDYSIGITSSPIWMLATSFSLIIFSKR